MKKLILVLLLLTSISASAVFVNDKGFGEVFIVPYYTVNNNLDTLVGITNTTAQAKALKIHFRESFNGHSVLSYNVYLSAFDTWTFVLSPIRSPDLEVSSVQHSWYDNSCNSLTTQLTPFNFSEIITGPQINSRFFEGYIEILEMGEFPPENQFYAAADLGTNGLPEDCSVFQEAWQEGGRWSNNPQRDIDPPTGGLMATADLINVGEGINYSIPVTALTDFFPDDQSFNVSPSDTELSLDAAKPEALVTTDNEQHELTFNSGIDAVSAVLMADKVYTTYVLDSFVAGKTDVVYTQPTRRFYFNIPFSSTLPISPPFNLDFKDVRNCNSNEILSGYYGGIEINELLFDRESQRDASTSGTIDPPPPPPPNNAICGSVFVHTISQPESDPSLIGITGSNNFKVIRSPSVYHATENGFMRISFIGSRPLVGLDSEGVSHEVQGIPLLGVTLFKFTNGGAAEGLLAQYGGSYPLRYKARVE